MQLNISDIWLNKGNKQQKQNIRDENKTMSFNTHQVIRSLEHEILKPQVQTNYFSTHFRHYTVNLEPKR